MNWLDDNLLCYLDLLLNHCYDIGYFQLVWQRFCRNTFVYTVYDWYQISFLKLHCWLKLGFFQCYPNNIEGCYPVCLFLIHQVISTKFSLNMSESLESFPRTFSFSTRIIFSQLQTPLFCIVRFTKIPKILDILSFRKFFF